ncbi:hypothetical protein XCR1_1340025 [Xenorhabdus cabanillasii JM26]|uniref:Transposase n=1 Tax=Xenorhabdus cabanillasii JM26 TaxID=1427517 RepID=W1IQG8_9GAMM|nr:hypothetical protein XCR1_1340025 [Xenorhabdus cabanillasii JM26]
MPPTSGRIRRILCCMTIRPAAQDAGYLAGFQGYLHVDGYQGYEQTGARLHGSCPPKIYVGEAGAGEKTKRAKLISR